MAGVAGASLSQFSPDKRHSDRERWVDDSILTNLHFVCSLQIKWAPVCRKNLNVPKQFDPFRWVCIYPAYLNSKKSRQQGRRLAKELCVEHPTYQEIRDVLTACHLTIGVENKLYPREMSKALMQILQKSNNTKLTKYIFQELLFRGRIRVHLKNDNGIPLNPEFPTRDSLLLHLGNMIPQLKSRQGSRASSAAVDSQQAQPSSSSGGGGGKKGGKGGKRR